MNDEAKSKAQLLNELYLLRERNSELEGLVAQALLGTKGQVNKEWYRSVLDTLEQIRQQNKSLATLQQNAVVLRNRLDLADLLEAILSRAAALAHTLHGYMSLLTEDSTELELRVGTGIFSKCLGNRIKPGEGLSGTVWATGQPLILTDYSSWPGRLPDTNPSPIHAALGIPLLSKEQVIGMIGLAYLETDQSFSIGLVTVLYQFAELAALALENAQLYNAAQQELAKRKQTEEQLQQVNTQLQAHVDELQQQALELTLLNSMNEKLQSCPTPEEAYHVIAAFMQILFPQESGAFAVIKAPDHVLQAVLMWGHPSCKEVFGSDECWALLNSHFYMVEDTCEKAACRHMLEPLPGSYLCVPVTARGEVFGVLHVSQVEYRALTEPRQRLAQAVVGQLELVMANLKLREILRNESIRDPLTGLFNRRYMEESLESELHRATRNESTIGVIMLDIDHFKLFNDTFGHAAGDTLLREVGQVLQTNIRGADIVCRYGGDEFTIIMPQTSEEVALQRAEALRKTSKVLKVQHLGQSLGTISISLGIAIFPHQGITAGALIEQADKALYRAKNEGRDRVVLA